jgi:hypothetical protein
MRLWARRRMPVQPEGRPIERIAVDLRRLGARYRELHPRMPFAKVEAVRGAYDKVLGECCTALGRTHLLGVLAPGRELDMERERVEDLVADAGVRFPHAA